jgi:hypothetical protein
MTRADGLGAGGLNVKPRTIDMDALHRLLWRRTDRFGRLKLNVKLLAGELELSYRNLTIVVQKMTAQGRLQHLAGRHHGLKTFVVVDPVLWAESKKD